MKASEVTALEKAIKEVYGDKKKKKNARLIERFLCKIHDERPILRLKLVQSPLGGLALVDDRGYKVDGFVSIQPKSFDPTEVDSTYIEVMSDSKSLIGECDESK